MNPINILFEDDLVLDLLRLTGGKNSESSEEDSVTSGSDISAIGGSIILLFFEKEEVNGQRSRTKN